MEKLKVDQSTCIGCGLCVSLNDEYFEFNDEGLSIPKKENVDEKDKKELLNIVDSCPVGAIVIEDEKEA
ncbi:MAG: ferredoxin [Tenericutes bacterium]|nr:ferredoxin [Mycoplasmatota bacterium]